MNSDRSETEGVYFGWWVVGAPRFRHHCRYELAGWSLRRAFSSRRVLDALPVKADSTWAFYLFAAIFGLSYGGNIVLIPKLTSHIFGLGSMGAIFGALSVADGLGFGTGPLMAGYIFDRTGSYQMSFFIVAAAMALALAATLALREESVLDRAKG